MLLDTLYARKMSEWKTLKTETVDAGGNNFIEVTLKQPPEGENLFIGFSKGWTNEEGQKRYKTNILFNQSQKDEVVSAIEKVFASLDEQ